ncbi:MAG: hypothetical protein RMI88_07725 [Nitrososphaerota archaeon]|nr:hypothetical protein [Nitrososphaerota archaeon]
MYDDKERKMSLTLIDEDIEKNIVLHTLEKIEKTPPIPRVSFNSFARLYTDALADAIENLIERIES